MEFFDYFILVSSFLLLIIGVIGSFIPVIPGPIISYLSLVLINLLTKDFTFFTLLIWGLVVLIFSIIDNVIQLFGIKYYGGKKLAFVGSIIGFIFGLLIPPIGFIIGTFLGGFIGALIENSQNTKKAFKIALGSFIGFFIGIFLKMIISFYFVFQYYNILKKLF
tara:strand:- start:2078 stop:2569 length:492 start_codon:yes stop_codon:yes gene_type:complete